MDDIKFKVQKEKDGKFFNVLLFLNGEKLSNHIFNTFDILPLLNLTEEEFDLYTCTCGVPGCAGFHDPVLHKSNEKYVFWIFSDDYAVEKKLYMFNKKLFNKKLSELIDKVNELENNNIFSMCSYDSIEMSEQEPLTNTVSVLEYIKEKEKRSLFNQKIKTIIDGNMPFFNYVVLDFNGFKAKYKKEEFVLMVLNGGVHYTSSVKEKAKFIKSLDNSCEIIMDFLFNKRTERLIELEKKIWSKLDQEDLDDLVYPLAFLGRVYMQKEKESITFNSKGININGVLTPYPNNFSINDKLCDQTVSIYVE